MLSAPTRGFRYAPATPSRTSVSILCMATMQLRPGGKDRFVIPATEPGCTRRRPKTHGLAGTTIPKGSSGLCRVSEAGAARQLVVGFGHRTTGPLPYRLGGTARHNATPRCAVPAIAPCPKSRSMQCRGSWLYALLNPETVLQAGASPQVGSRVRHADRERANAARRPEHPSRIVVSGAAHAYPRWLGGAR